VSDRLYPSRPILAVSVAVFRGAEVLLAARTRPPAENLFSLPGGVVEAGESLHEAALRELREEVDVSARIVAFNDHVEIVERDDDGRARHHFVVASFVARWSAGEGTPGPEAGAVRWVAVRDIGAVSGTPQLAPIVRRAFALLEARE